MVRDDPEGSSPSVVQAHCEEQKRNGYADDRAAGSGIQSGKVAQVANLPLFRQTRSRIERYERPSRHTEQSDVPIRAQCQRRRNQKKDELWKGHPAFARRNERNRQQQGHEKSKRSQTLEVRWKEFSHMRCEIR